MNFLEGLEIAIQERGNKKEMWERYWEIRDDVETVLGFFAVMDANCFLDEGEKIEFHESMYRRLAGIAEKYDIDDWKKSYFNVKLHLHQFTPRYGAGYQKQQAMAHAAAVTGLLDGFEEFLAIEAALHFEPTFYDSSVGLYHMPCEGSA